MELLYSVKKQSIMTYDSKLNKRAAEIVNEIRKLNFERGGKAAQSTIDKASAALIVDLCEKVKEGAANTKWIKVYDQTPPKGIEILAKSPEGVVHLCGWREGYDIFTVQCKSESAFDWEWMEIPQ